LNQKTNVTINSAVLYVVAFLITTIIHELAHAVAGAIHGSSPVLHHNYVAHFAKEPLSSIQSTTIAMAGPVVSLLQGLIAGFAFLKSQQRDIKNLLLLWLCILGFNNFLGYLMTGPLFQNGDVGRAYQLLNTPLWFQLAAALASSLLLLLLAYKLTAPFLNFSFQPSWVESAASKKNFSFHILILPWLVGSGVVTILYLPIVAIVSIIYPIMSGMVFIFPWQNARNVQRVEIATSDGLGRLSLASVAVLVILIMVFKLVLAPGIAL
jgi:hypothetical protein